MPPTPAAVWAELRVEVNMGQYLDLLGTVRADRDRALAHRIARYKSGKYTIERPLHIGATLAGRATGRWRRCRPTATRWARPSSSATTCSGRSATRRSRASPSARTCARASPRPSWPWPSNGRGRAAAAAVLDRVGDPQLTDDDVARIQQVLVDTGALAEVEGLIDALTARAVEALAEAHLTAEATRELTDLAHFVATRDR